MPTLDELAAILRVKTENYERLHAQLKTDRGAVIALECGCADATRELHLAQEALLLAALGKLEVYNAPE